MKENVFESMILLPAKLEPRVTIFQHGVDTYQVVKYLIEENRDKIRNQDLIKLAALVHDVGKIEQEFKGEQWIHTKYTREYLEPLLEDVFFLKLLEERGIEVPEDKELLIRICEEHHNPSPPLIKKCKESLLVSVADVIASMLESNAFGKIDEMLRIFPYTQLNLSLVKNLGFSGLDREVHRIDLPDNFVEDVFLANMIFLVLKDELLEKGLYPLLQRDSTIWIVGGEDEIKGVIEDFKVDPKILYDKVFSEEVYESILDAVIATTGAGGLQIDSLRFLLVNEKIAKELARRIITRDSVRKTLEKYDISVDWVEGQFKEQDIMDKIRIGAEKWGGMITGEYAAFKYHGWMFPPKIIEIKIKKRDVERWYGYLRNRNTFVGMKLPRIKREYEKYKNIVLLVPELKDEKCEFVDEIPVESKEDLLIGLIKKSDEIALQHAIAILIARRENIHWKSFVNMIEREGLTKEFGALFDILNIEARETIVPSDVISGLKSKIKDEILPGLHRFPFFGDETTYEEVSKRWRIRITLARNLVIKILDDLGMR
ncbi:MAG: HD domain-containing protein [Candidatus Syntropharchaeia archaeon]